MELDRGFRLGDWDVRPFTGDISSPGGTVHLEPKVMEVLLALARQAGDVVLREALLSRVWGARAAVSDEPLTRCIAQLRLAFGDSSRDPSYIQTIPKRGYRLMLAVEPLAAEAAGPADATVPSESARPGDLPTVPAVPQAERVHRRGLIAAALTLAVAGFAAYAVRWLPSSDASLLDLDLDPDVRRMYLTALDRIATRTASNLREAIYLLDQIRELAPDFADAYLERARASILLPYYSRTEDAEQLYGEAEEILIEGLRSRTGERIRPKAHGVHAYLYHNRWEFLKAEEAFEMAQKETPDDADMMQWYSNFLADTGHLGLARDWAARAMDADDISSVHRDRYIVTHVLAGEYALAEKLLDEYHDRFEAEPNRDAQLILNFGLGHWGELEALLRAHVVQTSAVVDWVTPLIAAFRAERDAASGESAALRATAAGLREMALATARDAAAIGDLYGKYELGVFVLLDSPDDAYRKVEFMRDEKNGERQQLDLEFLFSAAAASFRADPRFSKLLVDLGLVEFWRRSVHGLPGQCREDNERVRCA